MLLRVASCVFVVNSFFIEHEETLEPLCALFAPSAIYVIVNATPEIFQAAF